MKQKQMENDHALGLLQERLEFLQELRKVWPMIIIRVVLRYQFPPQKAFEFCAVLRARPK